MTDSRTPRELVLDAFSEAADEVGPKVAWILGAKFAATPSGAELLQRASERDARVALAEAQRDAWQADHDRLEYAEARVTQLIEALRRQADGMPPSGVSYGEAAPGPTASETSRRLREALADAAFALGLVMNATVDDRSWLDAVVDAHKTASRALGFAEPPQVPKPPPLRFGGPVTVVRDPSERTGLRIEVALMEQAHFIFPYGVTVTDREARASVVLGTENWKLPPPLDNQGAE